MDKKKKIIILAISIIAIIGIGFAIYYGVNNSAKGTSEESSSINDQNSSDDSSMNDEKSSDDSSIDDEKSSDGSSIEGEVGETKGDEDQPEPVEEVVDLSKIKLEDLNKKVLVTNSIGSDISEMYISPASKDKWQENLIKSNDFAMTSTREIEFIAKEVSKYWDVKVITKEKKEIIYSGEIGRASCRERV